MSINAGIKDGLFTAFFVYVLLLMPKSKIRFRQFVNQNRGFRLCQASFGHKLSFAALYNAKPFAIAAIACQLRRNFIGSEKSQLKIPEFPQTS